MLSFLWMGHIFDFFHISRNVLWLTQFLKMIESGFTIAKPQSFNILIDISSCPWALQILSDLIILMSLFSNWTEESSLSVIKVWVSGMLLLLSNGVQWKAKKQLKWFAFSLKFETSLLFIKSWEMTTIFYHYKKFLKLTSMLRPYNLGHSVLRLFLFTKFSFHHKWNESWLLVINMIYTIASRVAKQLPSKHLLVFKTSSTRLQCNNFSSSKTSWRRLANTSWGRLEDVLKAYRKRSW